MIIGVIWFAIKITSVVNCHEIHLEMNFKGGFSSNSELRSEA